MIDTNTSDQREYCLCRSPNAGRRCYWCEREDLRREEAMFNIKVNVFFGILFTSVCLVTLLFIVASVIKRWIFTF